MFLTRLKKISAKKHLNKTLLLKREVNSGSIRTVGVLVANNKNDNKLLLEGLAAVFGVSVSSIVVLQYCNDKKQALQLSGNVYTGNDLLFNGRFSAATVTNFIAMPFDTLISFYKSDDILLQLVSAKSKAKFKIGFSGSQAEIHDFSVDMELSSLESFFDTLKKYLSILKKI